MAYLNFNLTTHCLVPILLRQDRRPIMNEEKRLRRINIWELID